MHAVRYADDFKIFCASHEDAVRAYKATELWLKDRLGLEISPDKSKVVNLKRQYSDFLGFKLKVRRKGKKYVVRSHMSDKAYKKAHDKVSEEVKELAHSSDDNVQFMQLQKYNSVVAGLHEYYCISTEVSHDFSRLAFSINKQLRNRLKGDLSKKGQLRNGFIKEKYGTSRQMRFLHGRPVVPLGYVQPKNAQHKRKSINKYTVKGREQIHKNLAIDTATMLWLMRNPVKGRTIEYADNRISLYAAQYGKCAVTGIPMDSHDIHCHHKVPVSNGGSDEYATKKIGKNNPKEAEIRADNVARQEWNRTVDVALVEGVPEEDILTIKREKITDKTLQSIRTHGWLPDMFQQIIRGAKDFLQEMIFKFKLPPKPVPKIDLQEWNDMRKLMEKLQKQSQAMKSTQQEISSLKKQLSETTGFFKGKARKSLEGKIEQSEKQEKRIHTDMEQTVKQAGYPDVQSFAKTYQKSEKLVREYNEELRAWKNQTEPKKEKLSEPSKKASIREKLHRYQQESRQQPKQTAKKKSMDRGR